MILTQGHGCGIDKQKFAFLHDKVRTTHQITTKLGSFIALVMFITWLDFGEVFFSQIFFNNFGYVFSRFNTILAITQEWLVPLMWNENGCRVWGGGESFYSPTLTPCAAVVHEVKIHIFSIFFRASIVRSAVRHQGGRLLRQLCCWVAVSAQRTHDAKTTS